MIKFSTSAHPWPSRVKQARPLPPPARLCHSDCVKLVRSPFGYLVAVLFVLLGWVAATMIAAGAWNPVREANVTPTTEKKADGAGHTIAVYTDIPQPERTITCVADGPEKKQSTTIPKAKIDVITEVDGTEWHLVALEPNGRDGVTITCTPKDRKIDNAAYSYAVIDGFTSRGRTAQIVAFLGLFAGVGLAAATFMTRRRQQKEGAS